MISISKAKKIILDNTRKLPKKEEYFLNALGKVLAEDICAKEDWPPFSRSTMDGFAIRSQDVKSATSKRAVSLEIIDVSKAGSSAKKSVSKNTAIKIMTGAVMPKGADCVVMKEYTKTFGNKVSVFVKLEKGDHFRPKGLDARKGETVVKEGSLMTPGIVALLANFGKTKVNVYQLPKISILVTGDELLKLNDKSSVGKIRSANEYALFAQAKELGISAKILGIAKDNITDLEKKIQKGLNSDILLISGGVSVGEHDLVRKVLKNLSVRLLFWKVAVKPGKPLVFGKKGRCHVFGLPGNTVSSMVSFQKFVYPCILKMCRQAKDLPKVAEAFLDQTIKVEPGRTKVMRGVARIKKDKIYVGLSGNQISENVISVAKANCFFEIKEGITKLPKGSCVRIEYL